MDNLDMSNSFETGLYTAHDVGVDRSWALVNVYQIYGYSRR